MTYLDRKGMPDIPSFESDNINEFFDSVDWFDTLRATALLKESISNNNLVELFWDHISHFTVEERMHWGFRLRASYQNRMETYDE